MDLRDVFPGQLVLDPVELLVKIERCARKTAQNKLYLALDGKFEFPFPVRRLGGGRPYCLLDEVQAVLDTAPLVAGKRSFAGGTMTKPSQGDDDARLTPLGRPSFQEEAAAKHAGFTSAVHRRRARGKAGEIKR